MMDVGDRAYRSALHRWNELTMLRLTRERTPAEQAELGQLSDALDAAERRHSLRHLVDDYDELKWIGDLGGTEIL